MKLRGIFRIMMEMGYYPEFEQTHIQFCMDDNIVIVEYDEGILRVRLFFSIEEEAYDLFLEASNMTMLETYAVKPAILDDMKNIMFSCEFPCDGVRDFRRFFPRATDLLMDALKVHKAQMKEILLSEEIAKAALPAVEEGVLEAGSGRKVLS